MSLVFNMMPYGVKGGLNLPEPGKALNDYTWEEISRISQAGLGRKYFNCGDEKQLVFSKNGDVKIGDVSLYLGSCEVFILGFDHNYYLEGSGISFGCFRVSNISYGDISLFYTSDETTSGEKFFNMNHTVKNREGGWKGCDLRYDILGSTDVKGGDASENCPLSPVEDTLMALFPEELRTVMKPITKYTLNSFAGGFVSDRITPTVDYLPLLSNYEVFGESDNLADYDESTLQSQYDYYKYHLSKNEESPTSRYTNSSSYNCYPWLLRSATNSNSYIEGFSVVTEGGVPFANYEYKAGGLAPVFLV